MPPGDPIQSAQTSIGSKPEPFEPVIDPTPADPEPSRLPQILLMLTLQSLWAGTDPSAGRTTSRDTKPSRRSDAGGG